MFPQIVLILLLLLAIFVLIYFNYKLKNKIQIFELELSEAKTKEAFYGDLTDQLEKKNQNIMELAQTVSSLETELKFRPTKEEKQALERELIQKQEKLSSQEKLEADLRAMLEKTKLEITNQNREQYSAIAERLQKYTEEKNKEVTKEARDVFEKIIEKDVKETMAKMQESLQIQKDTLLKHQKPIEFFTKILAGSKESGSHGEQTIVNQLDNMGLKYGIDYFTQVGGRGSDEERLIADVVILIPNSGKKDVLIVDSKSSTKLGSDVKEFFASIESSFSVFAKKDYKTSVEKKLKELMPELQINQTHLFVYLPFDRMLSRMAEEKPEFLQKFREKEIGVLTPVILDFLLDTIKLYSAKLEFNNNFEKVMKDVKDLIERTSKVLEYVRDVGKSIDNSAKKYDDLRRSVVSRFVPIVNKTAKALDVKRISFDDINEEDLKEIEIKD